jgi:hypothetical protein
MRSNPAYFQDARKERHNFGEFIAPDLDDISEEFRSESLESFFKGKRKTNMRATCDLADLVNSSNTGDETYKNTTLQQ